MEHADKLAEQVGANEPQRATIHRLAGAVRGMHYANIVVRKDGQDISFEADWLRDLLAPSGPLK